MKTFGTGLPSGLSLGLGLAKCLEEASSLHNDKFELLGLHLKSMIGFFAGLLALTPKNEGSCDSPRIRRRRTSWTGRSAATPLFARLIFLEIYGFCIIALSNKFAELSSFFGEGLAKRNALKTAPSRKQL